jgi:predicted nucleic acid-binding protein
MIGLDTGFFVEFVRGNKQAIQLWQELSADSGVKRLVSCISIYELQKLVVRKVIDKTKTEGIISVLSDFCKIIWLDNQILQKSAQLSHKTGLAMGDALIVQSLIEGGARVIYTTDSDLAKHKLGPKMIRL